MIISMILLGNAAIVFIIIVASSKQNKNYFKIGLMRGYVKGYEDGLNRKNPRESEKLFEDCAL
jgi:hypothetical protein